MFDTQQKKKKRILEPAQNKIFYVIVDQTTGLNGRHAYQMKTKSNVHKENGYAITLTYNNNRKY